MKKVLSYLMAIALIVTSISFVGTDKVSTHQKHTTKGLVIDTSLRTKTAMKILLMFQVT